MSMVLILEINPFCLTGEVSSWQALAIGRNSGTVHATTRPIVYMYIQ